MAKKINKYQNLSYKELLDKFKDVSWTCFKGFTILQLALLMNIINSEFADHARESLPYNQHYAYTFAYLRNSKEYQDFHNEYLDYIENLRENGEISRLQYNRKKDAYENDGVEVFGDYLKTLEDDNVKRGIQKYNENNQARVDISSSELGIGLVATVGTAVGGALYFSGEYQKEKILKEIERRKNNYDNNCEMGE
jgi:hypothetical protein